MDLTEAINKRRSIRSYKDKPVEEKKLREVLEAGRIAPSASNLQDWKFIVIKNKETIKKLAEASNSQGFIAEAPVVVVCCSTNPARKMPCGQPSGPVDISIATTQMMLKAVEEGLGTCWIGAFNEGKVKKILDIPDNTVAVALFPLGYPKEDPSPRPRKDFEEVFTFEKWQ